MASPSILSDLDVIAATGANAVRVLLTTDALNNMSPQTFDQFFAKLAAHDMIAWVSFYTWNEGQNYVIGSSLGGGNFYSLTAPSGTGTCARATPGPCYLAMWDRQWIKDLMSKYRSRVILDAMQEYIAPPGIDPGSDAGRTAWSSEARTHIQFFRSRGYTQPLAIMTSFEGRDLSAIVQHGASIASTDTVRVNGQPQVIFGWQAYWSSSANPNFYPQWQGSRLLGAGQSLSATQAINTILPNLSFPVQVGLDNYSEDTNRDWRIQMDAAAAQGQSWLWWDWRNGRLDCPVEGDTCRNYVLTSQNGFAGARTALSGSRTGTPTGAKVADSFYYLNSLHNHAAGQGNLNTRVGNWVKRLASAAPNGGNTFTLGAQFGFFTQWTVPPRSTVGHEEVTSPYVNAYTASWTGAQNVEVVGFVPDNFDGVLFDPAQNTNMGASYQSRLLSLIDQWEANAPNPNRRYVVYAGWPQLNGYGGTGDNPTTVSATGYANWVTFGLGSYQTWMELLVSRLKAARPGLDIRLHNVNKAVLMTYRDTVVRTIPVGSLFEDLSPHGRSTWYFLAAVAEYIELYGEKPPAAFIFNSAWNVHPTVTANYQAIVDFMWGVLRP